ncbi:fatty acyl-CoA reductase wat-like [Coccinella septempunctata]|uniref:fatty acyl-CoA reductase wat-like n=1 Tax=Coccinella septempunctata TaxID=41139 RepID=UPI001D061ED0|nr:fatty acyl-CoA reductase wat-like [Coccinella septempunctata]
MSTEIETRQSETTELVEMPVKTEIQRFFEGQTVFVTGGTGFLGKLLIEKLLRCCYDLRKIYVLVRNKKGKTQRERFDEIFEAECFDPLKKKYPNFLEKVELVFGDCLLPDVGLSPESIKMLQEEVTTIFHIAATVRFDQHLKSAAFINVRSVRDLIRLSKNMPKLRAFLHVSTAFSFCPRDTILEEFYRPPLTGEKLLSLVDSLDDSTITEITPILLKDWPNSYVFTKAIAESVVRKEGIGLPIVMVRPAIVTVSAREPVPGWIDNMYGVTGVVAGAAMGALRTMPAEPDNNAEFVPVDFVINNIIAAAWDVAQSGRVAETAEDIPIYNYVLSPWFKITWKGFFDLCYESGMNYPTMKAIWYFCFALRPNPIHHQLALFFLHTVPAHFMDLIMVCMGKQPVAVKGYQKIKKFLDVISYFARRNWAFGVVNVKKLLKKMSPEDRDMFNFDLHSLDMNEIVRHGILGGRVYLVKDPLDTLPQARRKYMALRVAHYALIGFILLILFKIVSMMFRFLF